MSTITINQSDLMALMGQSVIPVPQKQEWMPKEQWKAKQRELRKSQALESYTELDFTVSGLASYIDIKQGPLVQRVKISVLTTKGWFIVVPDLRSMNVEEIRESMLSLCSGEHVKFTGIKHKDKNILLAQKMEVWGSQYLNVK